MTPQDFITKWGSGGPAYTLNERQSAQPHFIDLCQLLGVPLPGSAGDYIFEQDTLVLPPKPPGRAATRLRRWPTPLPTCWPGFGWI
ncbi:hypothetical protein [Rhodoferax sp.]|uniref:hypothetical protein n=1 Tax=Rhodoferax sp. TaxID=50421 RepID=UPI002602C3BC|nr:hypothetical protein [Rhodoferax sp.]MDD5480524.1 hypothetical protein [Rhodoferax sp.]